MQYYLSSIWGGSTTSVGNDYSLSFGFGSPVDKQDISVIFDATSVSVSSGANAAVSWTGHGLSSGSPLNFFIIHGGSAAGGVTLGNDYFVTTVINANSFNFSATSGGGNVTHI